jgi:hypothetical protein
MNTQYRKTIVTSTVIFLALAIVYVALILAADSVADAFAKSVVISTASSIFGAGLAFFLIRITQSANK